MANHMNATSTELRATLADLLGSDSMLYRRLDAALMQRDKASMMAAMRALGLYPAETRRAVEKALMFWLFDPEDVNGMLSRQEVS